MVDARRGIGVKAYGGIDDFLGARIVVDVNGDAAQGGHLASQLIEAGVVLPLALICFGHFCGSGYSNFVLW